MDDQRLKVIIVGDSTVGKTCLLLKFVEDKYPALRYQATVGFDFKTKKVTLNNISYRLQLWDTAGQERFQTTGLMALCYRDAHCVMFVYDVTNTKSYNNIIRWFDEALLYGSMDSVKILIGNKCDLIDQREVSNVEGQNLANKLKITFVETCVNDSASVEDAFMTMVTDFQNREAARVKEEHVFDDSIRLENTADYKSKKRRCLCVV